MELTIYDQENAGIPEIKWNYEELKKYTENKAKEYQSIAYTEADVPDMKKDRADINRFITALEDARKAKKKEYLAPYECFDAQVKEVLSPLRQTTALIGQKLDEVEQQYRDARRIRMQELYHETVGDLRGLISFDRTVKEEYYKKSFSDKKLKQAYIDFFDRIREEMKALDELPERFRDKALLKYVESFSLSDALREGKRLEEMEAAMIERRRKQEEEKAAMEEAKKREEARERGTQKTHSVMTAPTCEQAKHPEPAAEPILSLDFRAWGTREQLMDLRQYMIDNKIKFGKVE